MNPDFPIEIPSRLPKRLERCPIIEAVLELRFITRESWSVLPGLFFAQIRDKYPEQIELPVAKIPEEFRRQEQGLSYLPHVQFLGQEFLIQLGPRVISLVTKPNSYPGWIEVQKELEWLLKKVEAARFVLEGERIGVRYIDFFQGNHFPNLLIGAHTQSNSILGTELTLSTVFRKPPFIANLNVTNSAVVHRNGTPEVGSVLDIDVWIGSLDFEPFGNGLRRFDEAHTLVKEIFFGLLKPEFLAMLNPEY